MTSIFASLDDPNDKLSFFDYNKLCDDKYLKFLEILLQYCYKNKYIENNLAQYSSIASFVSRLIRCPSLKLQFLSFILSTFTNLKVTQQDIAFIRQRFSDDPMINTVIPLMQALVNPPEPRK